MADDPEPSAGTMEEMGRLCGAWSFLELQTEMAIWGILGVADKLGPVITSRLDMRGRWQLLLEWAPRKHKPKELEELRLLNSDVTNVNVDRNIIVHGLVHAVGRRKDGGVIHGVDPKDIEYDREPCWTISRGPQAGKNFPVSKKAVEIVRVNIQTVGHKLRKFNARFGYTHKVTPMPEVEKGWPKPI
jgi:hypothetical protein